MDKRAGDERAEQLEETIAHLGRTVDELSEVIARQDADIARLTARVDALMRVAAERQFDEGGSIPLADQRPPHW